MNEYPLVQDYKSSREPTPRDKDIGQRIRWCRKLKGMTLAVLAKAIGISLQQLAKYESGQNKIDASSLESVAKIFQVSAEELLRESPFEAGLTEIGLGLGDLVWSKYWSEASISPIENLIALITVPVPHRRSG
jgi:transcriptional regulator with XRE-family HTH domain